MVIGSGQGGSPLAMALAGCGTRAALVEARHVGGTCVNYGCTPTKTMVASARTAHVLGRAREFGVEAPPGRVDVEVIRDRKRAPRLLPREKIAVVVLAHIEAHAHMGGGTNALGLAKEARETGDEVAIVFDGAGTRWVSELADPENRMHRAFAAVEENVLGACSFCAAAFGVKEAIKKTDVKLLSEYEGHPEPASTGGGRVSGGDVLVLQQASRYPPSRIENPSGTAEIPEYIGYNYMRVTVAPRPVHRGAGRWS
ncbi:MAG: FAD-dependent oxidoreductase [Spirochaetaceae bacterium]